ncbi:hypothetical protein V1517DRAFT_346110 [Lipomyces orientalis]|uniref:Uncharacterized protein n=1 Tax=Lipomyces orientalis TaxID=1233043 RepID=A0ACC3TPM7_9ASCO
MASDAVGGSPSAAIAAMIRKKLGGGEVDVAAVEAVSQPGSSAKKGEEKKLTHMTKGRAKGPKRRLPTTAPMQADRDVKQSTASKVRFSEPEASSPGSKPIPREKPTPLSTKSHTFPSRSGNLLVSERLAMFSGRISSNGASFTEGGSTSGRTPGGLMTTSSGALPSTMTFKAADDKLKPATPAKPAFATIKSGSKARPVSLIFPPQKSSVYERANFADDSSRTQLSYKQPPAVPQKPYIQSLGRSSYSAAVSTDTEVDVTGPLKTKRTFPQTLPNISKKPTSLLQEKPSFPISSITSAAASKPIISKPAPKPTVDGSTTVEGIPVEEKEKPVLREKPLSTLRSLFESREKPLSSSSKSGSPTGLHSKPEPPRKPPIFHSRSKSYSGSSNVGKPSLPPKPKPLFARYTSDTADRLERSTSRGTVAHDYEMPAKTLPSKPRPVSVGGPSNATAPISELLSQSQTSGVKTSSEPHETSRRLKPASKPNLYFQEDKLPGTDIKSRMTAFSRAPTRDSRPPLSMKPRVAGHSVVREPPILTLLPKPTKHETEPVVTSKFSVRDAVSNWGVPSSRNDKGSSTITILPAQTPLVS